MDVTIMASRLKAENRYVRNRSRSYIYLIVCNTIKYDALLRHNGDNDPRIPSAWRRIPFIRRDNTGATPTTAGIAARLSPRGMSI